MRRVLLALGACALAVACSDERLMDVESGSLQVVVFNAGTQAAKVDLSLRSEKDARELSAPVNLVKTELLVEELDPGVWEARLTTRDESLAALRSIWVSDVNIVRGKTAKITVDMADSFETPAEICDGLDNDGDGRIDEPLDMLICTECGDGMERELADDERCGTIVCGGLDAWELRGENTAVGTSSCVRIAYDDLTAGRCKGWGECAEANGEACTAKTESVEAEAGPCRTLEACEAGAPQVKYAPDDTPCGTAKTCRAGSCVDEQEPPPETGCSDGTREGFVSLETHPSIAACSGGWSVGGVTRADLAPTCGRVSGDSSANAEGTGCSAADLCAPGWHVCLGKTEVAQKSSTGCQGAVPAGGLLLFAVAQASLNGSVCDDASGGDNDVFGCGTLGTALTADKGCSPLDRALASMTSGTCGFNEAEPLLGPWRCLGGADSHLHEGGLVAKDGCPGGSCSYDGNPVGNADKGGVLCCRD